ncbi:MAG: YkvA family protein [Cyclobacteriaceae bacterium]|nr:YkvA family protein [Cyclobacteriaceae bacterium]
MSNRVNRIWKMTRRVLTGNEKIAHLLTDVRRKLDKLGEEKEERSRFISSISMIVRMIRAHINGNYRSFSIRTLTLLVFGLVYFVTPTDLVPDFLPGVGLMDDFSLIYYILKSVSEDIEAFLVWEADNTALTNENNT